MANLLEEMGTQSLKNANTYDGMAWGRSSFFHQKLDFLLHVTESLLSLKPMSGSVKE